MIEATCRWCCIVKGDGAVNSHMLPDHSLTTLPLSRAIPTHLRGVPASLLCCCEHAFAPHHQPVPLQLGSSLTKLRLTLQTGQAGRQASGRQAGRQQQPHNRHPLEV